MNKKESPYQYLVMISQIGISVIVPIGLMILVGKCLDYFFHFGNAAVFICGILGVFAGFRNLYMIPLRLSEKAQRKKLEDQKKEEENEND
ncbi:MAG: AtpZ/AtpI family protein [Eubacteriaceae bacterium]